MAVTPAGGQSPDGSEGTAPPAQVGLIQGAVFTPDGARLPGAEVRIEGTALKAVTDGTGSFSFSSIPSGPLVLQVSCEGFEDQRIEVAESARGQAVTVVLKLSELTFEVTVSPDNPELMEASKGIGVIDVLPSQMSSLPSLAERDIFRSLQLTPGISASNESSSGLFVRGGTPDQNLVLLDGFTVYDVDHFFGIFSAFNTNAIRSLTIYKGGFDSRYGGRLSSVVDLIGNSGRSEETAFGGGIGFMSSNGYLDMPVGKKGTLMFAARRSFQSPFSNRIRDAYSDAGPGADGRGFQEFSTEPKSSFYDVNARATYDLTPKDQFIFSFYDGQDSLDNSRSLTITQPPPDWDSSATFEPIDGEIGNLSKWGNSGASASWFRNWTDSFYSRLTLAASRYQKTAERESNFDSGSQTANNDNSVDENVRLTFAAGANERNHLTDLTFRFQNFFALDSRNDLEFGTEVTDNEIVYRFGFEDDIGLFERDDRGLQYAFYFQDTWDPFPGLSITPGFRATYFGLTSKTYTDPRASIIYRLTDRVLLKAAGGRYHQFANRLVRENPLAGDEDFWILAEDGLIPVSSATHLICGISYETRELLFNVEGYRKNLSGLTEFGALRPPPGEDLVDIDLSTRFYHGTAFSKGVEFLAQKKFGRNSGWVTYTLGKVESFFPDMLETPYPASHDSTHEVKLVDSHRWRNFIFTGAWVYATGKPYTRPIGVDEVTMPNERVIEIIELGQKNSVRLPDYHRLDLSATWNFYRGESSRANLGVSVFNAYNHANVWRKEFDVYQDTILETNIKYLGLTFSGFLNVDFSPPSASKRAGPAAITPSSTNQKNDSDNRSSKATIYDFYGIVESMTTKELLVDTRWGKKVLVIGPASVTGASSYRPGTPVHVYYVQKGPESVVTMVVRVIRSNS